MRKYRNEKRRNTKISWLAAISMASGGVIRRSGVMAYQRGENIQWRK
jgi:hypothetical protein